MKTLIFIAVTLFSGAIAGTLLGLINQVVVEPYIDKAIGIQTQAAINAGQIIDPLQQSNYRMWQKGGEIVASTIYGISLSALFGVIFAYSRNSILLPGSNNKKKALVLAGIMFFVLFLIPTLKYPANPPGVGNPQTIYFRETLYVGFIATSGFTALALAFIHKIFGNNNSLSSKKTIIRLPVIYAIVMVIAYVSFPPNPDKITVPMDLIASFRVAGAFAIGIFWWSMGIILGSFWDRFKPYETSNITSA
jgi:predicted cobalt transporter CbtA